MEDKQKLLQDVKKMLIVKYPRFGSQIAVANLQFNENLPFHTAATDGKNIYFDPNYLAGLSDDDKLFIIAHELMHIKFEHMYRIVDKNGKKRDLKLWNTATDAIINANLERDGFKIKDGYVNMPEAINYSAEELYDKLLSEQQQQQQKKQEEQQSQGKQDQQGQGQGQSQGQQEQQQDTEPNNNSADDHSLWEEAYENRDNNQSSAKKQKEENNKNNSDNKNKQVYEEEKVYNERAEFEHNRQQRRQLARQKIEDLRNQELKKSEIKKAEFGNVGEAKPVLDWRLLLRREIAKTETIWSNRRSIAENNYAYRLEENDVDEEAETEVMIDVSGSISDEFVVEFLKQLKPLLRHSKVKVGFFADYATKSFQEIKKNSDVDKLTVYRPGYGTNLDSAVRAFTKKREVNKIIFTDGISSRMPREDLKDVNVIWLVYENRDFHPCCGTVINVYLKDLENNANLIKTNNLNKNNEFSM